MKLPIYMDYHATTPVDPRVVEAMLPYFTENFGNPASRHHQFGWKAEEAVENARATIGRAVHAETREIYLPVDKYGLVDPDDIRKAITDKTLLVSLMVANNEIGTIHPIEIVGTICHERGVLFHTDATQAVGKIPVDVQSMSIDLMSFSSHKIYGPKGVGALFVRRRSPRVRLAAQMDGGGHENGLRSGTLNVAGIVGFGKALEICAEKMEEESNTMARLRDRLKQLLFDSLGGISLNGHPKLRLPHNLHVSFEGVEAEALMMDMKEVAVSSGAACTTAAPEPSHVLRALGFSDDRIHSSIRFSLGRFTTEEEVDYVGKRVPDAVEKLRAVSPARAAGRSGSKTGRTAVPIN